jgi:hypothetical protein
MATQQELYALLMRQAALQRDIMAAISLQMPGEPAALQYGSELVDQLEQASLAAQLRASGPPPADDGDAARLGIGQDASPTLGGVFMPSDVAPYDEHVVSGRLFAIGDLYYCYQHERLGLFRAVQKLQELFRAGTLRLTDGPGALGLYRFDVKSVLRYTRDQRMQAYRRVFGYTSFAPPPGARANGPFHGLLDGFATKLAQLFRDRRIAEVVRGPAATVDATFGSVAATRRAGLDLRANLKHAAYGDVNVLTVELMQLLRQSFEILGAADVRSQFGSDNAWDTLEEVLKRYLNEESVASQRSRMGVAGRDIIRWLAEPFVLTTSRTGFEALALNISEAAEEWLTSAQSVGLGAKKPVAGATVVPFRRQA